MHYYTFNIADFNNATRHLTPLERAIYRELLDLQYDMETPLPNDLDWICKRICYRDNRTDVEQVLNEYYTVVEQGFSNARCEAEIEAFHAKHDAAVRAGKASGRARRRNKKPNSVNKNNNIEHLLNGCSTSVEQNGDSVEPTNNQEPITNNHKKAASRVFVRPTVQQVHDYIDDKGYQVDAAEFVDFYDSNGWVQSRGKKIKDWQACVRTWHHRTKKKKALSLTEAELVAKAEAMGISTVGLNKFELAARIEAKR